MMHFFKTRLIVSSLALLVSPAFSQTPPAVTPPSIPNPPSNLEQAPTLKASEILKPEILRSQHHLTLEPVPTAGFLNHYSVQSDFGVYEIKGNALLAKRIHEIQAMAALDKIEKSDEFKKALANTAKMPLHMVENLIDDPKGAAKQVGEGAKRFVHRAGEMFQRKGRKTKEEDNAFQSALGFSKAKRKLAWDLKVDPYTTNQALQKKLDDVAWATFAGEFGLKLGMLAIPGGAGTAITGVSTSSTIAESIRDNSPTDLSAKNRETLTSMRMSEHMVNAFLESPDISPTQQTIIVGNLSKLTNTEGRESYLRMCLSARTEADAIFFQRISQLMLAYHTKKSPLVSIFNLYGLPAAYANDQTLIIPLELDYGSWSSDAAKLAAAIGQYQIPGRPILKRQLVITGKVSEAAKTGLKQHGIDVIENVYNEGVYLR